LRYLRTGPERFVLFIAEENAINLAGQAVVKIVERLLALNKKSSIEVRAQSPLFTLRYFSLVNVQSPFKQDAVSLAFLTCDVSHSKQAAVLSLPQFYFPAVFS